MSGAVPQESRTTGFKLLGIAFVISAVKLLMVNAYRSTDYEVHRNWLAVTHSLPLRKWYTDTTSEWTLDYPPFFAWFELVLSEVAVFFDSAMLKLTNLNYVSARSVLFHRLSVIVADFVYLYASYQFSKHCVAGHVEKADRNSITKDPKLVLGALLMCNFGLFIIDHIHFQYNGFLFGIMLLSIVAMYQRRFMTASLHFATLLNFKHIYLYVAPAYGIYLLRVCCFDSSKKDGSVLWNTFSIKKFLSLAFIVSFITAISFGPFIYIGQLGQVLSRLFPFKRGLCHAYWAPNFWALYNICDKVLYTAGVRLNMVAPNNISAAMTGGLVQEFEHSVLPTIKPIATFILTVLFMLPCLIHLWMNPTGPRSFARALTLCGFTSFMFGWHVHEKAILLVIIPLALVAVERGNYARMFTILSITGHVSLFPLIYTPAEQPILYSGVIAYSIFTLFSFNAIFLGRDKSHSLNSIEKLYLTGLLGVIFYYSAGHSLLGLSDKLPFLPLLVMSVYTSVGITYTYLFLYRAVLSESMIITVKRKKE